MAQEGSVTCSKHPNNNREPNTVHAPIAHSFKTHLQSLSQFFALHLIQCVSHVSPTSFIFIYVINLSEMYFKKAP